MAVVVDVAMAAAVVVVTVAVGVMAEAATATGIVAATATAINPVSTESNSGGRKAVAIFLSSNCPAAPRETEGQ